MFSLKNQIQLCIFSIFFNTYCFAQNETVTNELTFSTGMSNVSYTETSSELSGTTNVAEATSGTISSLNGKISYKFLTRPNYAFYITGSFPIVSSDSGSYFNTAAGIEFYFNELGHQTTLAMKGKEIKLTPTFRYYVGAEAGGAYFTYFTETAKKQDYGLELTAVAGAIYNLGPKWSLKGEGAFSRGIGPATDTIVTKAYVGAVMFLEN